MNIFQKAFIALLVAVTNSVSIVNAANAQLLGRSIIQDPNNLVSNGYFEADGGRTASCQFSGWICHNNIERSVVRFDGQSNALFLGTFSQSNEASNGVIAQTLNLERGKRYTIKFTMGYRNYSGASDGIVPPVGSGSLRVRISQQNLFNFTYDNTAPQMLGTLNNYSRTFQAQRGGEFVIFHNTQNAGFELDNVEVIPVP